MSDVHSLARRPSSELSGTAPRSIAERAGLMPLPALDPAPAAELAPYADTRRLVRMATIVIGLGFGGFLAWAAWAPLDEGVPTTGTVSITTKRKTVQHLQGGIITDVLVTEGQRVEANQVLMRLDDGTFRANYEASRQRYYGLRAIEGRLVAEQQGAATIDFHPDLVAAAKSDPLVGQHMRMQTELLRSRRASLTANLAALDEAARGQQALIDGYGKVLSSRGSQQALIERELKGVRDLVGEGYAPLTRQLEIERGLADNAATSADLQANVLRTKSAIQELKQKADVLRAEYRRETDTQLSEVRRDALAEAERFKSTSDDLKRIEIRSPATGQVVGLVNQTVGGVVPPGQKLMDIVPEKMALVIEAQVAPNLIDQIRTGLPVDVRFVTFAHSPQLVVAGVVDSISEDVLQDPVKGSFYYLARIAITEAGLKTLGTRQLQPGMPVEVVVKTGERSMLSYLLHPLVKRMAASMKEQ